MAYSQKMKEGNIYHKKKVTNAKNKYIITIKKKKNERNKAGEKKDKLFCIYLFNIFT